MPPVASASVLHATAARQGKAGQQQQHGLRKGEGEGEEEADGEAVEKMLLLRVNIIKIHQSLPKTCEKLRFWAAGKDGREKRERRELHGKTQSACVCVCVCAEEGSA